MCSLDNGTFTFEQFFIPFWIIYRCYFLFYWNIFLQSLSRIWTGYISIQKFMSVFHNLNRSVQSVLNKLSELFITLYYIWIHRKIVIFFFRLSVTLFNWINLSLPTYFQVSFVLFIMMISLPVFNCILTIVFLIFSFMNFLIVILYKI